MGSVDLIGSKYKGVLLSQPAFIESGQYKLMHIFVLNFCNSISIVTVNRAHLCERKIRIINFRIGKFKEKNKYKTGGEEKLPGNIHLSNFIKK